MTARGHSWATTAAWMLALGVAACTVDFGPRDVTEGYCGDGVRDGAEICDGAALEGATCGDLGFQGGALACAADCSRYDTTDCTEPCGDGIRQGTELCDATDFGDDRCEARGYYGGTLRCAPDCRAIDESGCVGRCGDGEVNGTEVCDGSDLDGESCAGLGHYDGVLACRADCAGYDESGCSGRCGDGEINGTEVCDDADLGGQRCADRGYYGGVLRCAAGCQGFDESRCDVLPRLVINEVGVAAPDYVELLNLSEAAVDLDGWILRWDNLSTTGAITNGHLTLPAYTLDPGQRVVVQEDNDNPGDPPDITPGLIVFHSSIPWVYIGGAVLVEAPTAEPIDYVAWGRDVFTLPTGVSWADAPDRLPAPGEQSLSVSLARYPDGVDTDTAGDFCVQDESPQAINAGPCRVPHPNGRILVTEVDPASDSVELYNPGSLAMDLDGWALRTGGWNSAFRRLPAFVLPAGDYVVVMDDAPSADAPYADNAGLHVGSMTISGFGGIVQVVEPVAYNGVDFVRWGNVNLLPVPPDAWSGGSAPNIGSDNVLTRSGTTDTDDAADWCVSSTSSLGFPNAACP